MGPSAPLSKESPKTNTSHAFLVAHAGGWLDQLCMVCFFWIPSTTHMLLVLQPQSTASVMQEHFRGPGKVLPPQAETMVQSPSHELPASVSSRLNSGLCFPRTALRQCLPWDRAQYHLSFSSSHPWTLHCLLSPSCNTATWWLLVLSRSFQQLELATGTASTIELPLTPLPHRCQGHRNPPITLPRDLALLPTLSNCCC